MTGGNPRLNMSPRRIAVALISLTLVIVAAGYGYYRSEARSIRRHVFGEIATIADLKCAQIQQ
ncbi:MAG: hypothetical protein V1774_09025 [Candidatus Eisenbacteria bacterium]